MRTTRFHAVPFAELVHARTTAGSGEDGEPEADLYVYVAPRGAPLQALLLLADGTVGEGAVAVLPGGAVRLDLACRGPRGLGSFQVDLDVRDGSLCQQVRGVAGGPEGISDRSWNARRDVPRRTASRSIVLPGGIRARRRHDGGSARPRLRDRHRPASAPRADSLRADCLRGLAIRIGTF